MGAFICCAYICKACATPQAQQRQPTVVNTAPVQLKFQSCPSKFLVDRGCSIGWLVLQNVLELVLQQFIVSVLQTKHNNI